MSETTLHSFPQVILKAKHMFSPPSFPEPGNNETKRGADTLLFVSAEMWRLFMPIDQSFIGYNSYICILEEKLN